MGIIYYLYPERVKEYYNKFVINWDIVGNTDGKEQVCTDPITSYTKCENLTKYMLPMLDFKKVV